ncbi:hypothetical protein SISSUDRAFT_1050840 [Sistotremastrum suecicum HHB10207 ss-3]|uniref:Uncharacterized protein n=1 Tax=Sistotremastrum suecicum HHB10207 ss-3 TaxID=1314776 RepID=A0A166AYL9_9AGAM|nr:hypothetical protein SISSUDRAFT_1050840 [Sistotremastrum suecicum HHB10207 ss-3]
MDLLLIGKSKPPAGAVAYSPSGQSNSSENRENQVPPDPANIAPLPYPMKTNLSSDSDSHPTTPSKIEQSHVVHLPATATNDSNPVGGNTGREYIADPNRSVSPVSDSDSHAQPSSRVQQTYGSTRSMDDSGQSYANIQPRGITHHNLYAPHPSNSDYHPITASKPEQNGSLSRSTDDHGQPGGNTGPGRGIESKRNIPQLPNADSHPIPAAETQLNNVPLDSIVDSSQIGGNTGRGDVIVATPGANIQTKVAPGEHQGGRSLEQDVTNQLPRSPEAPVSSATKDKLDDQPKLPPHTPNLRSQSKSSNVESSSSTHGESSTGKRKTSLSSSESPKPARSDQAAPDTSDQTRRKDGKPPASTGSFTDMELGGPHLKPPSSAPPKPGASSPVAAVSSAEGRGEPLPLTDGRSCSAIPSSNPPLQNPSDRKSHMDKQPSASPDTSTNSEIITAQPKSPSPPPSASGSSSLSAPASASTGQTKEPPSSRNRQPQPQPQPTSNISNFPIQGPSGQKIADGGQASTSSAKSTNSETSGAQPTPPSSPPSNPSSPSSPPSAPAPALTERRKEPPSSTGVHSQPISNIANQSSQGPSVHASRKDGQSLPSAGNSISPNTNGGQPESLLPIPPQPDGSSPNAPALPLTERTKPQPPSTDGRSRPPITGSNAPVQISSGQIKLEDGKPPVSAGGSTNSETSGTQLKSSSPPSPEAGSSSTSSPAPALTAKRKEPLSSTDAHSRSLIMDPNSPVQDTSGQKTPEDGQPPASTVNSTNSETGSSPLESSFSPPAEPRASSPPAPAPALTGQTNKSPPPTDGYHNPAISDPNPAIQGPSGGKTPEDGQPPAFTSNMIDPGTSGGDQLKATPTSSTLDTHPPGAQPPLKARGGGPPPSHTGHENPGSSTLASPPAETTFHVPGLPFGKIAINSMPSNYFTILLRAVEYGVNKETRDEVSVLYFRLTFHPNGARFAKASIEIKFAYPSSEDHPTLAFIYPEEQTDHISEEIIRSQLSGKVEVSYNGIGATLKRAEEREARREYRAEMVGSGHGGRLAVFTFTENEQQKTGIHYHIPVIVALNVKRPFGVSISGTFSLIPKGSKADEEYDFAVDGSRAPFLNIKKDSVPSSTGDDVPVQASKREGRSGFFSCLLNFLKC